MTYIVGPNISVTDGLEIDGTTTVVTNTQSTGIWMYVCQGTLEEEHFSVEIYCKTCEPVEQTIRDYLWDVFGYRVKTNIGLDNKLMYVSGGPYEDC